MVRVPCTRLRVVIRNSKAEGLDPEPFPHIEAYNSSLAPALSDTEERLLRRHEEEKSKSCAEVYLLGLLAYSALASSAFTCPLPLASLL
jgi:hypothetical protein